MVRFIGFTFAIAGMGVGFWIWTLLGNEVSDKIDRISKIEPKFIGYPCAWFVTIILFGLPMIIAIGIAAMFGISPSEIFPDSD